MLIIPGANKSRATDGRTHYHATCYRIEPPQFTLDLVRVTDWPEQIEVLEALDYSMLFPYTPKGALDASARRRLAELDENDQEYSGVISSLAITDEDLAAGKYDGARIDQYTVDPRQGFLAYIWHDKYFIRSVAYDQGVWKASITSQEGFLTEPRGELWGPRCRVELFSQGDFKCNLNPDPFREEDRGVVSVQTQRLIFTVDMGSSSNPFHAEDGYGDDGTVTFVDGANALISRKILKSVGVGVDDVQLTVYEPFPFDIAIPTSVDLLPGCNKQPGHADAVGHCVNRYDNLPNFQGEYLIPGIDKATTGVPIKGG